MDDAAPQARAATAGKPRSVPFTIPSLDGIRAVSFLLVFLGHIGVPGIPGGFGVTVFFFLSGYLITTLLRREAERTGSVSLKLFYLRRILRIWPAFYLVLVGATLLSLTGVVPATLDGRSILAQALHFSNYWIVARGWDGVAPGSGVYWSLAIEEHFYLLLPAAYLALTRARVSGEQQRMLFLALCAVVLVWRVVLVFVYSSPIDRTYVATDARMDSLLFGCALAVAGNPVLDLPRKEKPSLRDLAFLGGGLLFLLSSFVVRDESFRQTLRYSLQGLGLYPLFVIAVRFPDWGPIRFLNLRLVRFVGTLSYSLYLVHHIAIHFALEVLGLSNLVGGALGLLLSALIALAIWRLIEEPLHVVRRRLAA
jgi:peptidoglycan/LPS O-acetylase OafA/YrhL